MATQEKLDYFYNSTMTALKEKGENELKNMKARLDADYEEYKVTHAREVKYQEHLNEDEIKRELLKSLAGAKLQIKHEKAKREAVIKDKLFEEVKAIVDEYRNGPQYKETLCDNIKKIIEFAGKDEVIIYLCQSDAQYKEYLEEQCKTTLIISDVPFNGGVQAEIPSRNIFINGSYSSRIEDAKKAYIVRA